MSKEKTVYEHLQSAGAYSGTSKAIALPIGVLLATETSLQLESVLAITALVDVFVNLILVVLKQRFK